MRVHSCVTTAAPFKGWFRQDSHKHPLLCRIHLPEEVIAKLQPTSETIAFASDPEYPKGQVERNSEQVLASRVL